MNCCNEDTETQLNHICQHCYENSGPFRSNTIVRCLGKGKIRLNDAYKVEIPFPGYSP
jgi:hypothetical protein